MATCDQLSEHAVINRVVNGDTTVFEILIRRYNPYLYKIGRSYGYNHHDVEDLMQETFIKAYQNINKLENTAYFKTWLVRIMLNECYKKKQKTTLRKEVVFDTSLHEKTSSMLNPFGNNDTEKKVGNSELNRVLENAIQQIPVDYRLVFTLREMNGMSVNETAQVLGITETNVKVRLNRAKGSLRKEVEKMYSPEDIYSFNLVYCDQIVAKVMSRIALL